MKKVFIIVLNWNRKKLTIECLKTLSLLKVSDFELNIILVDNGSTDGSIGAIRKFIKNSDFKENISIEILKNKKNLGFAEGNNVGIRHALKHKADYLLILNNDTLVDNNLISQLLKTAKKNKKAGLLCPKMYFAKGYEYHKRYKEKDLGKVIWYAGGEIDWTNVYGSNHGVDEVDKGQFEKVVETDFASGAAMFAKAVVLKKVGLFNKKYFAYLEDVDLSERVKRAGYKVLYAPPAQLWHKVSQTSGIGSDLNDYFLTRNRMLFGLKYAPTRAKLALIKESFKLLITGRKWQKVGIRDFYIGKFGKGSWK